MNTIRQIRLILYRLKRDFGQVISIIAVNSMTQNVETGAITVNERLIKIKRAVVLDAKLVRDFVYDLSFVAANKNFTYGGLFDTSIRTMLVDARDLPTGFIPTLNDRVIYSQERYQIKAIQPTAEKLGYILTVQQLVNQKLENVIEESLGQATSLSQEVTNA